MSEPISLEGLFTALVTPFNSKNQLDEAALEKLIENQLHANVNGLVVCGTTGESPVLTDQERICLIEIAVKKCSKKYFPERSESKSKHPLVLAGTGTNNTQKTIELSLEAQNLGADALLVVTPYYNKPSQHGLIAHYSGIADRTEIPVVLYNVPSRTGISLSAETVGILSRHPNIIGIKEASGNLNLLLEMRRQVLTNTKDRFYFLTGDDPTYWPFLSCGGDGTISVASNILPNCLRSIYEDWREGRVGTGLNLFQILEPFFKTLFIEPNPVPVKTLLERLGHIERQVRLPLIQMLEKNEETLLKEWNFLPQHIQNDKPREDL